MRTLPKNSAMSRLTKCQTYKKQKLGGTWPTKLLDVFYVATKALESSRA